MFVAINGIVSNGHKHIESAIKNGATAIIVEQMPIKLDDNVTYIQVQKSYNALGVIAANFYNNPSEKIKLIGVTGTNGKSTCCHHLNQILSSEFNDSQLIGNIGKPVLDNINTGPAYSIIELSSFQLEKVKEIKLDLGVLLNIAPDHIDHHGSFKEYSRVKNRIKESKVFKEESDPKKIWSIITGRHHSEVQGIVFENLPHRFERVWRDVDITFINDSKATNLAALEFALNKMGSAPYCLILCGDPNKEQYKNYKIIGPKKVFIFGAHAREIYKRISHPKKILLHNNNLLSVMRLIKDEFKDLTTYLQILFSPGHPSGNDYKNFEERGDHFKQLIQEIFRDLSR